MPSDMMQSDEAFREVAGSLLQSLEMSGIPAISIILADSSGDVLRVEPDAGTGDDGSLDNTALADALTATVPTVSGSVPGPWASGPVVVISTPLAGEGGGAGVLAAAVDLSRWSIGTLGRVVTLGETGYTEIVDANGVVLARTSPGSPPGASEKSDHPQRFAELISEGTDTVRTCHRCHEVGQSVERLRDVLAFAPLSVASWGVAIRQSEEEALEPAFQLRQRLLYIGAIVVASSLLLAWLVMQGVVKPVRMLTAAAQRVAGGDFMAATPVKRQDEIGQLNAAFYAMTQELARARDEIMLRNRQLRTYATYVTSAQEEERQRIARELHDETMQLVVLLCRRLDSVQASSENLPAELNDRLAEARETAEEVMRELRDFTKSLRPPILDDLGIVTSVRRLLSDLEERSEMAGHLEVEGRERRLLSDTELGLFRIAQEALHNAERHSEAAEINITFTFGEDETRLEVADNGAGFSPADALGGFAASGRLGLTSMRERAELLGGRLEIQSSPGHGTRVIALIPVPAPEGSPT